ncbi:cutinase family protein [Bifidobacterium sp. 82T24]|uniref:cutinase family protein n=1 Tax=Bifidobacterium pluvialisilvae TaxID=2834436 RepID=UPI001C56EE4A|nr:cutinase family protein [Bifidobacterium pluvialisilvae]MBW3088552.1 cutinase family protein [Bifidobacterium pluvialisilvae]
MGRNPRIVRALHNMMVMFAAIAILVAMTTLGACGSAGVDGSGSASASTGASASGGGAASDASGSSPSSSSSASPTSSHRDWGRSGCSGQDVRVVMARGTNENANDGLLNPVAKQIAAAFAGRVQVTSLDYPATFDVDSVDAGVGRLVAMLNGQAQQCPRQRTVLLGFSQGAVVVGDAMSAPKRRLDVSGNQDVLTGAAGRNIVAAVMYGDPRFNGKAAYNRGTFDKATNGSLSPRDPDALKAYESRIVDFCAGDDLVCQTSGEQEGHRSYFSDGSQGEGADFAIAKLKAAL